MRKSCRDKATKTVKFTGRQLDSEMDIGISDKETSTYIQKKKFSIYKVIVFIVVLLLIAFSCLCFFPDRQQNVLTSDFLKLLEN